jgi:hypothetical protein
MLEDWVRADGAERLALSWLTFDDPLQLDQLS